jgi:hypothetical protein
MRPEEYTEHVLTCSSCGSRNFNLRHDAVVSAISNTLRFHGMANSTSRTDLSKFPLPGNTKGGPDIIVHTNVLTVVDVAVCKLHKDRDEVSSIKSRIQEKIKKYEKFTKSTSIQLVPAVMSIYGGICKEFQGVLQGWSSYARAESLKFDVVNNMRCAVLRGLTKGVMLLHTKYEDDEFSRNVDGDEDDEIERELLLLPTTPARTRTVATT